MVHTDALRFSTQNKLLIWYVRIILDIHPIISEELVSIGVGYFRGDIPHCRCRIHISYSKIRMKRQHSTFS